MMSLFARKTNKKICPYYKTECIGHSCEMYIKIEGKHPQSGEIINTWSCAIKEVPTFLMYVGRSLNCVDGEISAFRSEQKIAAEKLSSFFNMLGEMMNGNQNIRSRQDAAIRKGEELRGIERIDEEFDLSSSKSQTRIR